MEQVTTLITGVFDQVKEGGLKVMTAAIALGVIFIGGKWLWGKTRQWLAKV